MAKEAIGTLFAKDINRRIEEVIKVDQTDEQILRDEIDEYVATDAIRKHFAEVFNHYAETPNKPHEAIGVWVSGFFGSGKSSFAKMLGLTIADRNVAGESAAKRFASRTGDKKLSVLLDAINEKIPTHAVIFDVSTDRGIRSGSQTLTEIMYGLFLQSLGYAKELDLSELEIALEGAGKLDAFKAAYAKIYSKDWDREKAKVAFAIGEASRVMHELDPATYPMADSWAKASNKRADITPAKLAERCNELMKRRKPGASLLFVVDEVGQFVARDVQKMLDVQAVVQSLGVKGRGKHWLVVTSQEKLSELVSGLDDRKVELARLMDRFPTQVHLEPSDISEVTSRRVLSKNAAAQSVLGKLYDEFRGRLTDNTRLSADIRLPELNRDGFIDLYPLLPYQIDLIIQVVSGLRTQGGASKHVGGANRTIIKLAQQLLINPGVQLAEQRIGALARIDQMYDLVEGNIASDIRAKIAEIPKHVDHPMAQAVAKAICLLQHVKSIHRTAENIAATLHPAVDADSQLASVKEALQKLLATHKVRLGDDGYRIPTPAEDDWERTRMQLSPKPGDVHKVHAEVLTAFWDPKPSHTLLDTKKFEAGLFLHNREIVEGDLAFHVHFAESSKQLAALSTEMRTRSQTERKSVFWVIGLNAAIDRETAELFRSREMLSRKEREARTADETALITEEKARRGRHLEELQRLLQDACLSGGVYFRGNDRSPADSASEVGRAASQLLAQVLPEVFDRFSEAAAKVAKKDFDAIFGSENLQGLTPVFGKLGLLRDEKGKRVFQTDAGPLAEVMKRIQQKADYGEAPNGLSLANELEKEPFGWEFDVVRLLTACLLRAGRVEATCKGRTLDAATLKEAREAFENNTVFKQASFRPRGVCDFETIALGATHFQDAFGREVPSLEEGPVAEAIRGEVARHDEPLQEAIVTLRRTGLPGAEVLQSALDAVRSIRGRKDCDAIREFSSSHKKLMDAIRRASELGQALTEPRLRDLERARHALKGLWAFLKGEPDLPDSTGVAARELTDLLARETFFRDLPAIDQHTRAIETEYERRFREAAAERKQAYQKAVARLAGTSGWGDLDEGQQRRIAAPLTQGAAAPREDEPIATIRADRDACDARFKSAVCEVMRTLEGERVVTVDVAAYFAGGVETEEQLNEALKGIREECERLIGSGKKILVQ